MDGLDAEWEERLTRWALGFQYALEEGVALPLYMVEVAHSPRPMGPVLESDLTMRRKFEQDRAAPGVTESHHNTGNRDTTPT